MKKTRLFVLAVTFLLAFGLLTAAIAVAGPVRSPDTTGGPDDFGYTFADSAEPGVVYDWVSITNTGTLINFADKDDGSSGSLAIGFPFNFYGGDSGGASYTNLYVNVNGWLSFDNISVSGSSNQCELPNSATPNNLIAAMWDDLNWDTTTGGVYYQTFASCPYTAYDGQCFIVEWNNIENLFGTDAYTFQIVLFDNSNALVQIQDAGNAAGSSSTTGIENRGNLSLSGTPIGLTYPSNNECNTSNSISDELAILFEYPSSGIVMTKTVGTSPNSCATTNAITVFPETEVVYCYEVENTGSIEFYAHNLTDSELGDLLTNFAQTLSPGATYQFTTTAVITQATVNTATWTAKTASGSSGIEASAIDSASVSMRAIQPGISLVKTVGTDPNICATTSSIDLPVGGGEVTYCYEVTNTGNYTLSTHSLTDDVLGDLLVDVTYDLGSSQTFIFTTTVTVTESVTNTAIWMAESTVVDVLYPAEASDTAMVNVEEEVIINPSIAMTKTVGMDAGTCATTSEVTLPAGGGEVIFCYTVANTGNATLNFHDLNDSEFGLLLDGAEVALAPDATYQHLYTATITQTTVNTATWTAYNAGPSDVVSDTGSATVTVEPDEPMEMIYMPIIIRP